jgi:hypothetical protein
VSCSDLPRVNLTMWQESCKCLLGKGFL